jgi:hypothetical protein
MVHRVYGAGQPQTPAMQASPDRQLFLHLPQFSRSFCRS